MIESQRLAYLEAMEIQVWLPRTTGVGDCTRLAVSAGSGSTLMLCRDAGESTSPLAADIARYLGGEPVWSWPDPQQNPANPSLGEAVDQHLATRVLIFGEALAQRLFPEGGPPVVRSAQIVVCADLDELSVSGAARKSLWLKLSDAPPPVVA